MLKCVYFKKLYFREKCIKAKYTRIIIVEGLGGLIDIFFHSFMPTVPHI